jgi:hypothetical protein
MTKTTKKQKDTLKRTVKYLSVAPSTIIVREVLKSAPDSVIRSIANAALNAQQGDVKLDPHTKSLFRNHSKSFEILTNRNIPINNKRQHLIQKGGALPIVVPLLASVLGSLGSAVISRIFQSNSNDSKSANEQ